MENEIIKCDAICNWESIYVIAFDSDPKLLNILCQWNHSSTRETHSTHIACAQCNWFRLCQMLHIFFRPVSRLQLFEIHIDPLSEWTVMSHLIIKMIAFFTLHSLSRCICISWIMAGWVGVCARSLLLCVFAMDEMACKLNFQRKISEIVFYVILSNLRQSRRRGWSKG